MIELFIGLGCSALWIIVSQLARIAKALEERNKNTYNK